MFTTDHIQTSSKQPMLVAFHNAKQWDVHHRPPTSTKQTTNAWLAFHNAKQWDVPPTTYKHRPCNQGLASYLPDAKKGWQKKE